MFADEIFDQSHTITLGLHPESGQGRVLAPGDIVGGSYRLKSLLGRGGMGYVFCAEHTMIGRDYALKLLAPEYLNQASRRRFEQEGRAIANLDHTSIVKVYNMGIDKGDCPYYVMDMLDGMALDERIKEGHTLDLAEALDIFAQIAAGLGYAHGKGVVHRDVKPSNIILLNRTDGGKQVKIVDFGIAKLLNKATKEMQSQTAVGEIFGTPYYMSPEQTLGGDVDERSDIYSLGCTMFETLCGSPPFNGQTALHTMILHQTEMPPSAVASQPQRNWPDSIDVLLGKMMAKLPQDRYQSMEQVVHDIERIKAGKTIGKNLLEPGPPAGRIPDRTTPGDGLRSLQPTSPAGEPVPAAKGKAADGNRFAAVVAALALLPALAFALAWGIRNAPTGTATPKQQPSTGYVGAQPAADKNSKKTLAESKAVESILPPDLGGGDSQVTPEEIFAARKVFDTCPPIRSRIIREGGEIMKEFNFPSVTIGRVAYRDGHGGQEKVAKGRVLTNLDEVLQFKVKASDCPSFFVPDVFKKVGTSEFQNLSLSGLGNTGGLSDATPGHSESDCPQKILKVASTWNTLVMVELSGLFIDEALLDSLDGLKKVNHLELHKCSFAPDAIRPRACFARLGELQVDRINETNDLLGCFESSALLQRLKLDSVPVKPEALFQMRRCHNFKRLEIAKLSNVSDDLIKTIAQMPNLTSVLFTDMPLPRQQLELLGASPYLHKVLIERKSYDQAEIRKLGVLPRLVQWSEPGRHDVPVLSKKAF